MGDIAINALAHGCARCSTPFQDRHFCVAAYTVSTLRSFERQVELGIIGASVRNYWVHLACKDPTLKQFKMHPDIQYCIRCNLALGKHNVVQPVYQIVDPEAINPADHTDKGVALGERVFFVHADCKNPSLNRENTNILLVR